MPRKPAKIDRDFTALIPGMLERLVELGGSADQPVVETFVVTKLACSGRAQYWPVGLHMRVVLHRAVFYPRTDGGENYHLYVLAHELAHIANFREAFKNGRAQDHHGLRFMRHFKRLCPPSLWHYETAYKPLNAMLAGISRVSEENVYRAARR